MGVYFGNRSGITPNTANDNWALDAGANESGKVLEVRWSGEATTSTAMRTQVARASGGATPTTATPGKRHPNTPTNLIALVTGWGTQPTLGDVMINESWNAHGGIYRWLAAPGEEFFLVGSAHISCRNAVGTAVSSYGFVWEED